jgi:prefoldin alpha subunit
MAKEAQNQEKKHSHAHEYAHEQQEKLIRLSMLEQDAKQLEQQLVMIEQNIMELQILMASLDDIENAKEKEEMLSQIGKNIFVRTELLSKDLLVNIGAKTIVKKNIPETKRIIEKDISKLSELRERLALEFQKIVAEMQALS